VLTPAFYAAGRPAIPVKVAVVSVAANALLSVFLMMKIGVVGLPLSTSLVALGSALWLWLKLRPLVPGLGGRATAWSAGRSLAASLVMGVVVLFAMRHVPSAAPCVTGWALKLREAALTAGGIGLGVAVFATLAFLMRMRELKDFISAVRRRAR
jgi:putative peptidoglycan lipid II flippase